MAKTGFSSGASQMSKFLKKVPAGKVTGAGKPDPNKRKGAPPPKKKR